MRLTDRPGHGRSSTSPPLHPLPRQLLETSLTLEAIVRTVWLDDENDLVLYYRVSA